MSRDYRLYLDDIQTSGARILKYAQGMTFDEFVQDLKTFDAVVFNLGVIGEAVKQIPEDLRRRYPDVDWRRIAGLRDVIVHGYFGLNRQVVWDLVQNRVPELYDQVSRMSERESREQDDLAQQ